MQYKPGDKIRIMQEGTIEEIIHDQYGIKYMLANCEGKGFCIIRNPKEIHLIETKTMGELDNA